MKRVMTPEVRRALSGLLPFAPGASVPFTPEAFQSVEEAFRPVFRLAAYSKADVAYWRGHLKSGTCDDEVIITILKNSGILGWTLPSIPDAELIPYTKEAVAALPENLLDALHLQCAELTFGPTKVEKEGLESQPRSAPDISSNPAQSADATPA